MKYAKVEWLQGKIVHKRQGTVRRRRKDRAGEAAAVPQTLREQEHPAIRGGAGRASVDGPREGPGQEEDVQAEREGVAEHPGVQRAAKEDLRNRRSEGL